VASASFAAAEAISAAGTAVAVFSAFVSPSVSDHLRKREVATFWQLHCMCGKGVIGSAMEALGIAANLAGAPGPSAAAANAGSTPPLPGQGFAQVLAQHMDKSSDVEHADAPSDSRTPCDLVTIPPNAEPTQNNPTPIPVLARRNSSRTDALVPSSPSLTAHAPVIADSPLSLLVVVPSPGTVSSDPIAQPESATAPVGNTVPCNSQPSPTVVPCGDEQVAANLPTPPSSPSAPTGNGAATAASDAPGSKERVPSPSAIDEDSSDGTTAMPPQPQLDAAIGFQSNVAPHAPEARGLKAGPVQPPLPPDPASTAPDSKQSDTVRTANSQAVSAQDFTTGAKNTLPTPPVGATWISELKPATPRSGPGPQAGASKQSHGAKVATTQGAEVLPTWQPAAVVPTSQAKPGLRTNPVVNQNAKLPPVPLAATASTYSADGEAEGESASNNSAAPGDHESGLAENQTAIEPSATDANCKPDLNVSASTTANPGLSPQVDPVRHPSTAAPSADFPSEAAPRTLTHATEQALHEANGITNVAISGNNAQSEIHVALQGEKLGSVELHARVNGEQVGAAIVVEKRETHAALAVELPALRDALSEKNLRVEHIWLTQGALDAAAGDFADTPRQFTHHGPANSQQHGSSEPNFTADLAGISETNAIFDERGHLSVHV